MRSNEPMIYTQEQVAAWEKELKSGRCSLDAIERLRVAVSGREDALSCEIRRCEDYFDEAWSYPEKDRLVKQRDELTRGYRELEARRDVVEKHLRSARQLLENLWDPNQAERLFQALRQETVEAILKFENDHPDGQSAEVRYWLWILKDQRILKGKQPLLWGTSDTGKVTNYFDLNGLLWRCYCEISNAENNHEMREIIAALIHQRRSVHYPLTVEPNVYQNKLCESLNELIEFVKESGSPAAQQLAKEIAYAVKHEKHPDLKFYHTILSCAAHSDGLDYKPREIMIRGDSLRIDCPVLTANRNDSLNRCYDFARILERKSERGDSAKMMAALLLMLVGLVLMLAAIGASLLTHGGAIPVAIPVIGKGFAYWLAGLSALSFLSGGVFFYCCRLKGVSKALSDFYNKRYQDQKQPAAVSSALFTPARVDRQPLAPALNPVDRP